MKKKKGGGPSKERMRTHVASTYIQNNTPWSSSSLSSSPSVGTSTRETMLVDYITRVDLDPHVPSASRICGFFFTANPSKRVKSIDKERGRQRAFHFSRSAQRLSALLPGACPVLGNMSANSIRPRNRIRFTPSISDTFQGMESIQGSLYFFHAHPSSVTPTAIPPPSPRSICFLDLPPIRSPQAKPFPDPSVRRPPHSRHSSKPRQVYGPVLSQHGSAHVNSLDESQHHRLGRSSRFWLGNIKSVIQLYHKPIHELSIPLWHFTYLAFEAHRTLLHP